MAIDYAALKEEIELDPVALGYSEYLEKGSDKGIMRLLNKADTGTISRGFVTRSEFVAIYAAPLLGVVALAEDRRWTYQWLYNMLSCMELIDLSNPTIVNVIAVFAADGLCTPEEAAELRMRPCTRAETLFGEGASVGLDDIARALRGDLTPPSGDIGGREGEGDEGGKG